MDADMDVDDKAKAATALRQSFQPPSERELRKPVIENDLPPMSRPNESATPSDVKRAKIAMAINQMNSSTPAELDAPQTQMTKEQQIALTYYTSGEANGIVQGCVYGGVAVLVACGLFYVGYRLYDYIKPTVK
jgi:hypothetical protein